YGGKAAQRHPAIPGDAGLCAADHGALSQWCRCAGPRSHKGIARRRRAFRLQQHGVGAKWRRSAEVESAERFVYEERLANSTIGAGCCIGSTLPPPLARSRKVPGAEKNPGTGAV